MGYWTFPQTWNKNISFQTGAWSIFLNFWLNYLLSLRSHPSGCDAASVNSSPGSGCTYQLSDHLLHLKMAFKASLSSDITAPCIFHSPLTCPSSYGQYLTVYTCSYPLPLSPTTHCVLSSVVGLYFAALPSCFSLPVFPAALFVFQVSADLARL